MKLSTIFCVTFTVTLTLYGQVGSTVVNSGRPLSCDNAEIAEVRIANCDSEPCRIVKGEHLPLEIDFSFQSPNSTDAISFAVEIHYWGVGNPFMSYFARGSGCTELLPESTCPAESGLTHKLKSNLYVDPKSADSLTGATTGQRFTIWRLSTSTSRNSYCSFSVYLDIVEG